jgi:hypothetical protein
MGDAARGNGGASGINAGAATADLPLFTRPYPVSSDVATKDAASIGPVPIAACSSKCFTGDWTNANARLVAADLHEGADHRLAGVIRLAAEASHESPSGDGAGQGSGERMGTGSERMPESSTKHADPEVPVPILSHSLGSGAGLRLTECVLIYDRWAYVIPKFSAAEPIDIEQIDPRTADTYFSRGKIVAQHYQVSPYDRASTDRARILETMMFYRAAGGLQHIGLLNRYQHSLDLSEHLALDQAILIGIGPPASKLTVDGHPIPTEASAEHVTIYRFLIPVRTP